MELQENNERFNKTLTEFEKSDITRVEIIDRLEDYRYKGDISDIGNEIGIVIGKYSEYDIKNFISGLNHGISLSNGTH